MCFSDCKMLERMLHIASSQGNSQAIIGIFGFAKAMIGIIMKRYAVVVLSMSHASKSHQEKTINRNHVYFLSSLVKSTS